MKISMLAVVWALLTITGTTIADERPGLWILSGQSNACGRAALPGPKPDPRVLHYDPTTEKFLPAEDPLPGMGTTGVGPWVAAGQEAARGGMSIKMVGFASGGKPIEYWHPGKAGDVGLFPRIEREGQGADVFLWYQGENNTALPEDVATYQAELKKLVGRVRDAAANPKLMVVVVQLGAFTRPDRHFMSLREAQRQFVAHDGNAVLVPALGRPLKDTVHLNNAGYQELGREIGRALLRRKYGQQNVNWPGPVLDQAVMLKSGNTMVAHFAEVVELSGALPADFAVIDAEGVAVCEALKAGKTLVELQFARPVTLPAKLVYAYGENPAATLVDEGGNRAPAVQIAVTTGEKPEDVVTEAPNGAAK